MQAHEPAYARSDSTRAPGSVAEPLLSTIAGLLPHNGQGIPMTRLLEKCVAVDTPTVTDIFTGGLSEASLGELIDAADSMTRWQGPDRVWLVKRACATKNVAARTAKHESVTARPRRHGTFKEAADHLGRIYYWDV